MSTPTSDINKTADDGASQSKDKKKGTPKTPPKDKKTPPGADDSKLSSNDLPEFDPKNPNKLKITPDCIQLQLAGIQTMSALLNHFVHANNLEEDQTFSLVIDDCTTDTHQFTEIIDLGIGIGC